MTSSPSGLPEAPLSRTDLEKLARKTTDLALEYLASISQRPLRPQTPVETLKEIFSQPLPKGGSPIDALLDELKDKVFDNSTAVGSSRFFGLMDSPPLPVAVFADMLASALNQNLANWSTSPAATFVELEVVRWFAQLAGLRNAAGLLVSSGSVGNLLALRLARNHKLPLVSADGIAATQSAGQLKVYCSQYAHSSLDKAVEVLGLGYSSLVKIETDNELKMRVDALDAAVVKDESEGNVPLCVVATAGTTFTGAIDPLAEIAAVCRKRALWFHVDAAYGGAALFSKRAANSLQGISLADSLVIDPHKWLFVPFQAAVLLARRDALLSQSLGKSSSYIYDAPEGVKNLSDFGIQGSKRFDALKVWLALKMLGAKGYRSLIETDLDNAAHFYRLLLNSPEFQPHSPPQLGIVAFRFVPTAHSHETPPSPKNRRLIDDATRDLHSLVMQRGRVWLGIVNVEGGPFLQACFSNYLMKREDVDFLYSELTEAARILGEK